MSSTVRKDADPRELTFLVVDDNRFVRSLIMNALRSFGIYQFKEAADGADALKILRDHTVDFVLTDNEMDPITGIELTRIIRSGENGIADRTLPVIMITGFSEQHRIHEAINAGVHEILVKPISADILFKRIAQTIRDPRPFIIAENYIGPCRRRNKQLQLGPVDRRENPARRSMEGKECEIFAARPVVSAFDEDGDDTSSSSSYRPEGRFFAFEGA